MRMMLLAGAASLAGGGAYVGGAFDGGQHYDLAPAEVASRLAAMPLPEEMTEAMGETQLQLHTIEANEDRVKWALWGAGQPLANITADLDGGMTGGTNVSIDFEMATEGEIDRIVEQGMPMDSKFIDRVIEIGIAEQVDAHLEGRELDQNKVAFAVTAYMAAHPGEMKSYVEDMEKVVAQAPVEDAEIDETWQTDSGYADGGFEENPGSDDWGQ